MAFAGGMTVFPGGGVDAADKPDANHWAGPDPSWWGGRLGCEPDLAGALVSAAVRETFEECGVLLATPGLPEGAARLRADLVAHRRALGDVLAEAGLVLRSDMLRPWARWITPTTAPRRYDTAFFVACLPDGQEADAHTTEAVEATWWHPTEALEHWEQGDMKLMAPTFHCLQEIAEHPDSAAVLASADERVIRPVTPIMRRKGEQIAVVLPGEPGFEITADSVTPWSGA
jgi:8-oxo-dGTP pyrophosphatase MutT (NUDIX family)